MIRIIWRLNYSFYSPDTFPFQQSGGLSLRSGHAKPFGRAGSGETAVEEPVRTGSRVPLASARHVSRYNSLLSPSVRHYH
jgi:hypothetical protein